MSKKIFTLAIVLIILIIAIIAIEKPFGLDEKFAPEKEKLVEFEIDDINKIAVTKENDTIELIKTNNQWFVSGDKFAKQDFVLQALNDLKEADINEVVSKNKEKHSNFTVDEEKGIKLSVWDNNENNILNLFIGKNASSPNTQYVRYADSDNVLLVDQDLNSLNKGSVDNWRERNIWTLEKDKITKFSVKLDKKEFSFEKGESNTWSRANYGDNAEIDNEKFEQILSSWLNVNASEFAEDNDVAKYGLEEGKEKYTVKLATDTFEKVLHGGNEEGDKNLVFVKQVGNETVYKMSKSLFENLEKLLDELK